MVTLAAAFAGAAIVGGLVLLAVGLIPQPPAPERPPGRLVVRLRAARARVGRVHLVAAGAGLLVLAVTGWPAAALGTAALVVVLPMVLRSGQDVAISRLEALEDWTRHLADLAGVPGGLEQVLTSSARSAPEPIAEPVRRLAAQLQGRVPVEDALRGFADDLASYDGDMVVATLLVAARRRGGGLGEVLTRSAESLAERVAAKRRIESDRAKPRATARWVTVATLVAGVLLALNPALMAPYGTPLGQVLLGTLIGAYIGVLLWMRRLAHTPPEPRFLVADTRAPP